MSIPVDKETVIRHKKAAFKTLDNTLEWFINSANENKVKKANLISYWIETYCKYIKDEESFDYSKVLAFNRGEIVQVNFGFRVGSELGGLHYAIVLDNDNRKASPVVTVIPVSSGTAETTYERDVFIGNEIYEKLKAKCDKAQEVHDKNARMIKSIQDALEGRNASDTDEKSVLPRVIEAYVADLKHKEDLLQSYYGRIGKMKSGSIALVEQITTISKMRIYEPKNDESLLYGIKISDSTMDKITAKIGELYMR